MLSEQQISKADMICACGFGLCSRRLFFTECYPLGARWLYVVRSGDVSASQRFQMYYFYKKSNQRHGFCPLYIGCLPFGEPVIRGFTVRHIECIDSSEVT